MKAVTQCSEIMRNEAEPAGPETTADAAARIMREAGVGLVAVCDVQGRVLGVVTDRDIAMRVCGEGRVPSDTSVAEIMTRTLVSCRPNDPLSRAEQLMIEHHKSRILLVDESGRLEGVISLTDIAQCEEPLRAARVFREISQREYRFRKSSVVPPSRET